MNKRHTQNTDGFVVRRRAGQPLQPSQRPAPESLSIPNRFLQAPAQQPQHQKVPGETELPPVPMRRSQPELNQQEMDASLSEIDAVSSKKRRRLNPVLMKRLALFVLVACIIMGLYFGFKAFVAGGKVFQGSLFDLLGQGKQLQQDEYGRSNILVFGTSEDDPSHANSGADLADSIMVLSLDQKNKQMAMFSVPRDLYVKYGEACASGYEGKINVAYMCGLDGGSEKEGSEKLMNIVGDHFGLDMHYYVHVNYTVLRESVDAVGGITVKIESSDPRGVLDRNFDWTCGYKCYLVKWPNGPAQLNGEQALALARARNDAGGYGLSRGNFDREQYQQKIMIALKDKAVSGGTLANPIAVNGLIDALGENVRTNFDAAEVKTLVTIASEINNSNIKRIDLTKAGSSVLTTGSSPTAGSIVRPIAGLYDFSKVQSYVRSQLTVKTDEEGATIEILNGSDYGGVAGKKADELAKAGLTEVTTGDTPTSSSYAPVQWYDLSGGNKPKTREKLKTVLGISPRTGNLPTGVQSEADFVIILGNGSN
jgi:LCP family protein required for cell wall assembly